MLLFARIRLFASLLGFVFMANVSPRPAFAQNTTFLPLGERTGTMGGTGIAFGDDSAMALLNPAGLANVSRDALSLSLSVYSVENASIDGFFAQQLPSGDVGNIDASGNRLASSVIRTIPTSLTYVWHFGDKVHHILGVSVLAPRSLQREFDATLRVAGNGIFDNVGVELIESLDTYYIGPTYALAVEEPAAAFRIGASFFLVYSDLTRSIRTDAVQSLGRSNAFASDSRERYESGQSFDFVAALGVQVRVGLVSIGLSLQTPSVHLGGNIDLSTRSTFVTEDVTGAPADTITQRFWSGDYTQPTPMRFGLGLAADFGKVLLAADVTFTRGLDARQYGGDFSVDRVIAGTPPTSRDSEPFLVETELTSVLNFNVGVEFILSPSWILRTGGFTDFSATTLPPEEARQPEDVLTDNLDRFGATLGLTVVWGSAETTLGLSYVHGTGELLGFDTGNLQNESGVRVVDATTNTYALSVASTVDIESLIADAL